MSAIIKWETSLRGIRPREIVRETEKFVTVKYNDGRERRVSKKSSYNCFFDTFEEAKAHVVREADEGVITAELLLGYAREKLAKANALSEGQCYDSML